MWSIYIGVCDNHGSSSSNSSRHPSLQHTTKCFKSGSSKNTKITTAASSGCSKTTSETALLLRLLSSTCVSVNPTVQPSYSLSRLISLIINFSFPPSPRQSLFVPPFPKPNNHIAVPPTADMPLYIPPPTVDNTPPPPPPPPPSPPPRRAEW